jgi:drug/metabolite transporter (DMT)-like permease
MIGVYIAAVKTTTAANAIYLQYTATFWVIPLSALFLGERPDRRSVIGIAFALVGIGLIVARGYDGRPNEGLGILEGLASGLAYAAVAVGIRKLRDLHPVWLSAVANLGGALVLSFWIIVSGGSIPLPGATTLLALIAFGVLQMAIPYALFARGLREIGAVEAGLLALVEPLVNPLWVALAHGEVPARATVFGGLFLLAGLICRFWPGPIQEQTATAQSSIDHSRAKC